MSPVHRCASTYSKPHLSRRPRCFIYSGLNEKKHQILHRLLQRHNQYSTQRGINLYLSISTPFLLVSQQAAISIRRLHYYSTMDQSCACNVKTDEESPQAAETKWKKKQRTRKRKARADKKDERSLQTRRKPKKERTIKEREEVKKRKKNPSAQFKSICGTGSWHPVRNLCLSPALFSALPRASRKDNSFYLTTPAGSADVSVRERFAKPRTFTRPTM